MKKVIILFCLLIFCLDSSLQAAINAQFGFENGVPGFVKVAGSGTVTAATEKFKDGKTSLKYQWTGQSELTFNNWVDMEASMKVNGAGLMIWIYNTAPMDAPLKISFTNWSGEEICYFHFNMNFKGWRTAWVKYIDMCRFPQRNSMTRLLLTCRFRKTITI